MLNKLSDYIPSGVSKSANNIIDEVLKPSAERMAFDLVDALLRTIRDAAGTLIFKEGYKPSSIGDRTSYDRYYKEKENKNKYDTSIIDVFNVRNCTYKSMAEALSVKDEMLFALKQYGRVSVLQYYDISRVDMATVPSTSSKFGWRSLSEKDLRIVPTMDGKYIINLPKPEAL